MTCDPNGHIYYTDDGSLEVEVQYDEYCDDEWQTDYTTASLSVFQIAVALLVVVVLFVAAYVYWLIQSADLAEQLRHIREQQRRLLPADSAAPRPKFEPPVDKEEPLIIVAATEPTPPPTTTVDSSGIDTIPARDAIAGEDDLETGTGGSAVPEQRCDDDDDESSIVDDEGDSPPTNEPIIIAVATEPTTTTVDSSSIDTIPARDREETEGVPSPNSGATMTSTTTTNHP